MSAIKKFLAPVLVMLIMLFSISEALETRTLTIRCPDGVLLVYGQPDILKDIKIFLLDNDSESQLNVNDALQKLKSLNAFSSVTFEAFYEQKPVFPYRKKLYKIALKDAVEKHLVPDIRGLSLQEARKRLEIFGFNVFFLSSKIGNSTTVAPCDISVQSAGKLAGSYTANLPNGYAWILVNGKNVSVDLRGYNVAVIDQAACAVTASENFDTRDDEKGAANSQKMAQFINKIANGKIVAAAVRDEGSKFLTPSAVEALKTIGSKKNLMGYRNYSHAILGIKGFSEGQAMEDVSSKAVTLSVTKGLHTEEEIEKAFLQSAGNSVFIRDTEAGSLIGIATTDSDEQ